MAGIEEVVGTAAAHNASPYVEDRESPPLLGDGFDAALLYASWAHRRQLRKGTDVPYLSHLLGVCSLVLEYGGSEEQAIAALLHDTVEDCGNEHKGPIAAIWGDDVLGIVLACSDVDAPSGAERPSRQERKEAYIRHLSELDPEHPALLVSACDKLHNARAIRADLRRFGDGLWDRFNAPREDQLWYYGELAAVFEARLANDVVDELRRTVDDIRTAAGGPPVPAAP